MATATRERLLLQTNCFWNMHIATFKFEFIRELQISSLTCKCNIKCSVTSLLICTDNIIIPYARGLWRSFLQQVYILFLRSTLLLLRSVAHVWPLYSRLFSQWFSITRPYQAVEVSAVPERTFTLSQWHIILSRQLFKNIGLLLQSVPISCSFLLLRKISSFVGGLVWTAQHQCNMSTRKLN